METVYCSIFFQRLFSLIFFVIPLKAWTEMVIVPGFSLMWLMLKLYPYSYAFCLLLNPGARDTSQMCLS